MEQIEVTNATAEQLRRFGATVLGLEVKGKESKAEMISKFEAVSYNVKYITLGEPAPVPTSGPDRNARAFNRRPITNDKGEPRLGDDGEPEHEVLIILQVQDKPGGDRPVPVGVNGRQMLIPRGNPVWVPEKYVEALDHAVEFHYPEYDPEEGDGLGGLREPRRVQSYPFNYA